MSEGEMNRNPRPVETYRFDISSALRGNGYFSEVVDVSSSLGWQPIYVKASSNGLSLFKQLVQEGDHVYTMSDNIFTYIIEDTNDVVLDLTEMLDILSLETILNLNRDVLASRHFQILLLETNRVPSSILVYRQGDADTFHVIPASIDDILSIEREIVESLVDVSGYESLENIVSEYPNLELV